MKIDQIDLDKEVFVIAEVGNNHEGSFALAEELVGLAAEAGVHCVKFQTFKTELFTNRKDEARFNRLKKFELTQAQFEKLAAQARSAGILFMSTPLDLESAEFLGRIAPAFKIASGDNNFYALLELVANTGKPVFLSTGLADVAQLKRSKSVIESVWQRRGANPGLAMLHCVSSYPVPPEQANLAALAQLRKEFPDVTPGYSDHTIGIESAVLSVALGARVIEKHFTKDKNYSDFRDHQLSADPRDMKLLVERVKEAQKLLGHGRKEPQPCEDPIRPVARRSIVAGGDLPEGHVLSRESINWMRPGDGLQPGQEELVLGKKLKRALKLGDQLRLEDLESR